MRKARCASKSHEGDRCEGVGRRWKCPKCRKMFCSECEGIDDGWKVCDGCWFDVHFTIAGGTRYWRSMIKRWVKPGQRAEIAWDYGYDWECTSGS